MGILECVLGVILTEPPFSSSPRWTSARFSRIPLRVVDIAAFMELTPYPPEKTVFFLLKRTLLVPASI